MFGRGSCSTEREEEGYEFASYLDEGSCDEEEEYQPISEGDKDVGIYCIPWKVIMSLYYVKSCLQSYVKE